MGTILLLFARRTLAIQTKGKTNDSGHNVDGFRGGLSATKHTNLPGNLRLRCKTHQRRLSSSKLLFIDEELHEMLGTNPSYLSMLLGNP